MNKTTMIYRLTIALTLFAVFMSVALPAMAQETAASPPVDINDDIQFASGLAELGLIDIANKVLENYIKAHPERKPDYNVVKVEILVKGGRLEDALKIVEMLPPDSMETWKVKLTIAQYLFAKRRNDEAQKIYEELFSKLGNDMPNDPKFREMFQEAAYQYAKMQEMAQNFDGAIKGYLNVIKSGVKEGIKRRLQSEIATMYLKMARDDKDKAANLTKARAMCDELMWEYDVWCGKAIATMAYCQLLEGKVTEAEKTLSGSMPQLKQIEDILKKEGVPMALSPIPNCKIILGELFERKAKAAGDEKTAITNYGKALKEYINIAAHYGDSEWAPDAVARFQEIKNLLETKYKKEVKFDAGKFESNVVQAQLKRAKSSYYEENYEDALKEYLRVVNSFPDALESVKAMRNIVTCYAELDRRLDLKMAMSYCGERYSRFEEDGATPLLVAGKFYFDKVHAAKQEPPKQEPEGDKKEGDKKDDKQPAAVSVPAPTISDKEMYEAAYRVFVDNFPKHERTAGVLYALAILRKEANDDDGYLNYLKRIMEGYKGDKYYSKSVNLLAWLYYKQEKYDEAANAFGHFVEDADPSPAKIKAQYQKADSYLRNQKYSLAMKEFNEVVKWMGESGSLYMGDGDDAVKTRELEEKATYYIPYCLSRAMYPTNMVPQFREMALPQFEGFVKKYTESKLAPKAMNNIGRIYLEKGEFDKASATFNELTEKYPESEEGKSALYSKLKAAVEIENYDVAKDALKDMVANAAKYDALQFMFAGGWMVDSENYPEAIQAFEQVLKLGDPEDKTQRGRFERTYHGLGKSYFKIGDYEKAAKMLRMHMKEYPRSSMFYEVRFLLNKAYRELQDFEKCKVVLEDIFLYGTNTLLNNQASIDLGDMQLKTAEQAGLAEAEVTERKRAALASYQRISLLADAKNPKLKPLIESAILKSIELFDQLAMYKDLKDECDHFMEVFPESQNKPLVNKYKRKALMNAPGESVATEAKEEE